MNCSNCGADLPEGTNFCPNCGARVQVPTVSQQQFGQSQSYSPPAPTGQVNSEATPTNASAAAETPKKKSHTWIWVVGIVLVIIALSYGMLGRGGFTASTSNPASIEDFTTYIKNEGYSPNTSTGASNLIILGYNNVDDNTWYGEGNGYYDAEVSCNGTNYRLRYTSSGSDKGWQVFRFAQSLYGVEDDLRKCSAS